MRVEFLENCLRELKKLQKKYPKIAQDIKSFVKELEKGDIVGDRIQNPVLLDLFKARIKNSSTKSGKSGGFRVIYYVKKDSNLYIISIYSKTIKSNISAKDIIEILGIEGLI